MKHNRNSLRCTVCAAGLEPFEPFPPDPREHHLWCTACPYSFRFLVTPDGSVELLEVIEPGSTAVLDPGRPQPH